MGVCMHYLEKQIKKKIQENREVSLMQENAKKIHLDLLRQRNNLSSEVDQIKSNSQWQIRRNQIQDAKAEKNNLEADIQGLQVTKLEKELNLEVKYQKKRGRHSTNNSADLQRQLQLQQQINLTINRIKQHQQRQRPTRHKIFENQRRQNVIKQINKLQEQIKVLQKQKVKLISAKIMSGSTNSNHSLPNNNQFLRQVSRGHSMTRLDQVPDQEPFL